MAEEEALAVPLAPLAPLAKQEEVNLSQVSGEPEEPVIELGDRIRIIGGKYDRTTGKVLYRTESELHIIPDGLTNQVIEFELTEEGFDPALEIEGVEILQKRKKPTLVEILDLRVGQDLETFSADGETNTKYRIVSVDPETDTITINNEAEGDLVIPFGFKGIPKELPFRVIRGRQPQEITTQQGQEDLEGLEDTEGAEGAEGVERAEGNEELEEEDFQFLDDELLPAGDTGVEQLIEIPTSERTYSNQTQKSEAYADLLSLNTPARQKQLETQKSTRALTEIFFRLRASILRTSDDGTPKGIRPSSIQTLADALEKRQLNLSRPVVDVDKILYHDMDVEQYPQPEILDGIRLMDFNKKTMESDEYLESSPDMAGQKFTQFLNGYLQKFGASWRNKGTQRIAFQKDEEVFRRLPPEREANIPGYPCCLPRADKGTVSSENISEISMSLIRGLRATRNRGQLLQEGEEATVLSYVMFPLKYASSLSFLKGESLIADVMDGKNLQYSMKDILKETNEITDIPSASQPFLISVDGGTLGNITLRDYIKALGIRAEGMGDIWPIQVLLGMTEREWTIDQYDALKQVIGETQNQILKAIIQQREALAQKVAQPPAIQGMFMIPDSVEMIEKIAEEPILKELQATLKDQMPAFASSDITMIGLLLRNHPDITMAQLANQPAALTRSRMKYARDEYLKTLNDIQLKKKRIDFAGEPPEPIQCSHVKPLAMIRKVKDDSQRLALLSKFLITFQGHKVDNWIKCNAGDHNLLCMHELLQIYQFLRPGDVAALNKDIQLNFGGGQFQGHYICRNCGQPISELEYDTHLEFDDSGRPMMGRSVLEDTDTLEQSQIESILGTTGDLDDIEGFDDMTKKLIYTTAKELADRLLAPLDMSDFITIVNRVYGLIQQIPSRERYVQFQTAQKKGKSTTVTDLVVDYDVYINQALVCSTAVHLLLHIQTRKPDLILRGMPTGCRNLGGQPLEPEGGTQGIQCVVSIVSSFQKDSPPWSLTQFQKEPDDSVRQKTIMGIFEPFMRASLQDPTILQALSQKREYLKKILGAAGGQGRPDEELPANFAPIPYVMKEEDFVEKIIVPEAASDADRVELWIRQGNFLAKKNKMPMPLAFSETSCCLSPLEMSDEFWERGQGKQSLPPFSRRSGVPPPPKITRMEPTMKPSQISRPLPNPPESSFYQLFLKVCYDGEKKGRSHEFGLTHKCMWCDLSLPAELELLTPEQGLTAIESQGIEVTKETFEDLLNETHKVNRFETKLTLEIPGPLQNWEDLLKLDPEPMLGYRETMAKTTVELTKLPPDAKEVEVALALSDFSTLAEEAEQRFKQRMPSTQHDVFDSIEKGGAGSIGRFLQSYILVPLSQFTSKNIPSTKVPKSWGLSWQHQLDVSHFLNEHRTYLMKFNKIGVTPWLKAKVDTFIAQVRPILDIMDTLRPMQIPGGKQTYEYFLKFCLYAPLANFADPDILPIAQDTETPSHVEPEALFPAKFVSEMLNRFKVEGLKLTPEQIRELIAARKEEEKANILRTMTKMSRAEKDISKIQMKLGIGEWAVGGTKAIYAYDAGQYDKERDQRAKAGIVDFQEFSPEAGAAGGAAIGQGGQGQDALGYEQDQGDEAGYIDDDELGNINGFDDDN